MVQRKSASFPLAAMAIEDHLDFRFMDFASGRTAHRNFLVRKELTGEEDGVLPTSPSKRQGQRDFLFKKKLEWRPGRSYFEALEEALEEALRALHAAHGGTDVLDDLRRLVISVPGVIKDRTRVVQLPLWTWPFKPAVNFDFSDVIPRIIRRITSKDPNIDVIVVNDTVAGATAAYFHDVSRARSGIAEQTQTSAYLRAHNGINLAYVEHGRLHRDHSEAGHVLPFRHPIDDKNDFMGVCPYHVCCVEGFLAPRSWTERAKPGREGVTPVKKWKSRFFGSRAARYSDEVIDAMIMKELMRGKRRENSEELEIQPDETAQDITAFYLAQLMYTAFLLPPAPQRIYVGGRMATEPIIKQARVYVGEFMKGYPDRDSLVSLDLAIRKISTSGQRFLELSGALLLGLTLTIDPGSDGQSGKRLPRPHYVDLDTAAKVLFGQ